MSWERICSLEGLPAGSMREVDAAGKTVLVVRSAETVSVLPPSCPHMQTALADGVFDGCVLTCTKHLWQWTIEDGEPTGALAETPLLKYPVRIEDDAVYADLERELRYEHELDA